MRYGKDISIAVMLAIVAYINGPITVRQLLIIAAIFAVYELLVFVIFGPKRPT